MNLNRLRCDRDKERGDDRQMIINVYVTPNSNKPSVSRIDEKNYEVKVDERAEAGRANGRLIDILSEYFGVTKSSTSVVRGSRSRDKVVLVRAKSRA